MNPHKETPEYWTNKLLSFGSCLMPENHSGESKERQDMSLHRTCLVWTPAMLDYPRTKTLSSPSHRLLLPQ